MNASTYTSLFNTCAVTEEAKKLAELDFICRNALIHQDLYSEVQGSSLIPWPLISCIHFRESNQNFTKHLHNGDPLTARTVHVPKNRPVFGTPPFTWVESAKDALKHVWRPHDWSLPSCLEFMERYNGLGYEKMGVLTPYLWDYTDMYHGGLFVADGTFNPDVKESRPGCVSILKSLMLKGINIDFKSLPSNVPLTH